jgi:PAS domain S-box-containing protein
MVIPSRWSAKLGGCVAAVAVTVPAVLVRWLLDPWVGNSLPLVTLYGAVAAAVWLGGYQVAVLAMVLGYLACDYLFIEPRGAINLPQAQELFRLAAYLLFCGIIIGFGEAVRSALADAKRRADALRAARVQLQIVTDSMSALVTRCSRDLRYLWVSRPYAAWLGRAPDEIVGHPILEVLGPEAFEKLRPHFERVLAGQTVHYEEAVKYPGLGRRWIHAVYSPTFDAAGVPDGWVAVITDIDDRKRAEEALKEANRKKDEFLATLAHELRTPLAPIRNAVQVMRLIGSPDPQLQDMRDLIDRQVQQMARLVDDLSEVSRIGRG